MRRPLDDWRGFGPFVREDLPAHRSYYAGAGAGLGVGVLIGLVHHFAAANLSGLAAIVLPVLAAIVGLGLLHRPAHDVDGQLEREEIEVEASEVSEA